MVFVLKMILIVKLRFDKGFLNLLCSELGVGKQYWLLVFEIPVFMLCLVASLLRSQILVCMVKLF